MKGLLRFETLAAIVFLAVAVLVVNVYVPYGGKVYDQAREIWVFWNLKNRVTDIDEQKKQLAHDNRVLDSLIKRSEERADSDDNEVLGLLYTFADESGLKTSKMQIGERLEIDDHFETSITVHGRGKYTSLGEFCEKIENMPAPVRIRQITANGASRNRVDAIIDFLVMTK